MLARPYFEHWSLLGNVVTEIKLTVYALLTVLGNGPQNMILRAALASPVSLLRLEVHGSHFHLVIQNS